MTKVTAFILITVKAGADESTVEKLRGLKGIAEVHEIYGAYDILIRASTDSVGAIKALKEEILRLGDIRDVNVINVARAWKKGETSST